MYIITKKDNELDIKGNQITYFHVLDTKDMVTETFTKEELLSYYKRGIQIIGIFNNKDNISYNHVICLINENELSFSHSLYLHKVLNNRVYLALVVKYKKYLNEPIHAYDFSIDVADFNDFNRYLNSIGKFIRYDKNNIKASILKGLDKFTQYSPRVSDAKTKLLYGITVKSVEVMYTFAERKNLWNDNGVVPLLTITIKGTLRDSSFFDSILKYINCKHCVLSLILSLSTVEIYSICIPTEKLNYVYSSKLLSV